MLTPKQERFCQHIVEGFSQAEAYRQSHPNSLKWQDKTVWSKASLLMSDDKVSQRVAELLEESRRLSLNRPLVKVAPDVVLLLDTIFPDETEKSAFVSRALSIELVKIRDGVALATQRRRINAVNRYAVLERAGFRCQACGVAPSPGSDVVLHIDHIIPFSLGGSNQANNLQVLCQPCNNSKGNRHIVDHCADRGEQWA